MYSFRIPAETLFAVFATLLLSGSVHAQTDSYTDAQLARIRNTSVGQGYSIDSVNKMSLNRARANVQIPGVGNGGISTSSLGARPSIPRRQAAAFDSFGSAGSPRSKPFANISREPTISPYANLFYDPNGLGANIVGNYNSLVRPQLQQRQVNNQFQQQAQLLNRRVQELAAKPAFNSQGSATQAPTGHSTGFMYYSHFYPALSLRR